MLDIVTDNNRYKIYEYINQQIDKDPEKYKFFGRLAKREIPGASVFECVSKTGNRINGYMSVVLDLANNRLVNFSLLAFKFNKSFYKDLKVFMNINFKTNSNFEFRVCTSSPAYSMDVKLFERYGFEKLGTIKKSIRIDNTYFDEDIFVLNKR